LSAQRPPLSAIGLRQACARLLSALRSAITAVGVAGPVVVVAVVLGGLCAGRLVGAHGNPSGLILFGRRTVQYTHPLPGAPETSPAGYDGQFYWIQANDPLLLHRSTIVDLHRTAPGYALQPPPIRRSPTSWPPAAGRRSRGPCWPSTTWP
jgi:hypothetical protein